MSNDNKKKQTWTSGRSVGKKKLPGKCGKKKQQLLVFFSKKGAGKEKKQACPKPKPKLCFKENTAKQTQSFFSWGQLNNVSLKKFFFFSNTKYFQTKLNKKKRWTKKRKLLSFHRQKDFVEEKFFFLLQFFFSRHWLSFLSFFFALSI